MTVQTNAAQVVIDFLPTGPELSDPLDAAGAVVVTGSVLARAPDWSVAGTFAASDCPDVNEYAICE